MRGRVRNRRVQDFREGTLLSNVILIREATIADIDTVAHHRVAMFSDMNSVTPDAAGSLKLATQTFLRDAIPRREYRGWLASFATQPSRIVAGAGLQLRRVLPFPRRWPDGHGDVAHGREAIVLNVYTEPAFRRQGLARRLMHEVLSWARAEGLESLVLHAAPDGCVLYERVGFAPTNEMRYMGDLAQWTAPTPGPDRVNSREHE
jgi:GNAT superfamily N-acetyltransferase